MDWRVTVPVDCFPFNRAMQKEGGKGDQLTYLSGEITVAINRIQTDPTLAPCFQRILLVLPILLSGPVYPNRGSIQYCPCPVLAALFFVLAAGVVAPASSSRAAQVTPF
jgi:hypothetical protein